MRFNFKAYDQLYPRKVEVVKDIVPPEDTMVDTSTDEEPTEVAEETEEVEEQLDGRFTDVCSEPNV